jgi:hypothetical protein
VIHNPLAESTRLVLGIFDAGVEFVASPEGDGYPLEKVILTNLAQASGAAVPNELTPAGSPAVASFAINMVQHLPVLIQLFQEGRSRMNDALYQSGDLRNGSVV